MSQSSCDRLHSNESGKRFRMPLLKQPRNPFQVTRNGSSNGLIVHNSDDKRSCPMPLTAATTWPPTHRSNRLITARVTRAINARELAPVGGGPPYMLHVTLFSKKKGLRPLLEPQPTASSRSRQDESGLSVRFIGQCIWRESRIRRAELKRRTHDRIR
jgi:hypothetical protein